MATSSSRSDLSCRRLVGKVTPDRRSVSALAQQLVGSPLPVIKCDDCPQQVIRRVSTMPEHPGWEFLKCKKDGMRACFDSDGCKVWCWEEDYIDLLITKNLLDVRALLARVETRCDAMSNSSKPKKKRVCKLEKPIERINNEDREKNLIPLVGAVMEVGHLLKCLIVILVFFGLVLVPKNWLIVYSDVSKCRSMK
ncbi:hypothetical protein VPH35_071338 [Triticum aestivum]